LMHQQECDVWLLTEVSERLALGRDVSGNPPRVHGDVVRSSYEQPALRRAKLAQEPSRLNVHL
jgi:hypothetical protein